MKSDGKMTGMMWKLVNPCSNGTRLRLGIDKLPAGRDVFHTLEIGCLNERSDSSTLNYIRAAVACPENWTRRELELEDNAY